MLPNCATILAQKDTSYADYTRNAPRFQLSTGGEQATVKCVASWTAEKSPSLKQNLQAASNEQNLMNKGAGKPTINGFILLLKNCDLQL